MVMLPLYNCDCVICTMKNSALVVYFYLLKCAPTTPGTSNATIHSVNYSTITIDCTLNDCYKLLHLLMDSICMFALNMGIIW